jgi:hypothetical protein
VKSGVAGQEVDCARAGFEVVVGAIGLGGLGERTGRRTSLEADGMLDCVGDGHGCVVT